MAKLKTPKLGRPELRPDERKSARLGLKFTTTEKAMLDTAAQAAGFEQAGAWARKALLALAHDSVDKRRRHAA